MLLRVLCASLIVLAIPAWSQERPDGQPPAKRIVLLARELAARPNDPRLHAGIAVAYFERGAEGDAQRAFEHRDRALALDPDLASPLASQLDAARPGLDTGAPTAEMSLADMQSAATLPPPRAREGDDAVRAHLAARLARSRFEMPSLKFKENLERVHKMFHAPGDPTEMTADRSGAIGAVARATTDPLERGFLQRLEGQQRIREELQRQRQADASKAHLAPDPMLLKARAYLTLLDGDVAGALAHLEQTVAAAETHARQQLEEDGGASIKDGRPAALGAIVTGPAARREPEATPSVAPISDDDWDDPPASPSPGAASPRIALVTPPREMTPERRSDATPDRDVTPPRIAPPSPTLQRAQTSGRAGPIPERGAAGDAPEPPRVFPPAERNRRIGEQALESIEAARTPEVPPVEVRRRVRELATINEVGDPLVVDLDGDGRPSIPGGLAPDGLVHPTARARFDLDADGHAELIEWMAPGDALVCFDLDGDGRIASGREVAGAVPGRGDAARWLALRDLDGDGALAGVELAGCVLWRDDGDASCEPGEVVDARAAGVTRLCASGASFGAVRRAVWEWLPDVR